MPLTSQSSRAPFFAIYGPALSPFVPLVLVVVTSLVASFVATQAKASKASNDFPPPGQLISVGEHRLHLYCVGKGEPTVVMDAGLGGNSVDWVKVQPAIARDTRVCTYDRAGNGWSEPGPLPRTSERIALELRALLRKSNNSAPFVLVGHSFGGYNVRMFASRFPDETVGLVLVDASHEDQYERFRKDGIGVNTAPRGRFILRSAPQVPDGMPAQARVISQSLLSGSTAMHAVQTELSAFIDSAAQVRQAPELPDVPLVVITRGKRLFPKTEKGNRMERVWRELQNDLVALTSQSTHVIAEHSGHHVHLDEPNVVTKSVQDLVHGYRIRAAARPSY